MKKIISLLVALVLVAAAAWLTPKLMADPGVLVLRMGGYQIEMRALVALGLVLLAITLFWAIVWLIRAPAKARRALAHRRGRSLFSKGLLALSEGRWPKAEKWLAASAKNSPTPELSYMAAARAAMAQQQPQKAEEYLKQAEAHIDNPLTVDLTRAELWLKTGHTDQATALLQRILKSYPNNPRALSLMLQAAQTSGQWQAVRNYLPKAQRLGLLPAEQAQQLAQQSLLNALQHPADEYALLKSWNQASATEKAQPQNLTAFARSATRLGLVNEALNALEKHLKKHWPAATADHPDSEAETLEAWVEIASARPDHLIKQAGKWLKKHPDSAALYKALGIAWMQKGDQQQALENFEKAAQLGQDRQVLLALANLHEALGHTEQALAYHKRANGSSGAVRVLTQQPDPQSTGS
jgi:HemY protein